MEYKSEHLKILKKIQENPDQNQRDMAKNLNLSLGKINYCLNALKKKGLIKVKNFNDKVNKNLIKIEDETNEIRNQWIEPSDLVLGEDEIPW